MYGLIFGKKPITKTNNKKYDKKAYLRKIMKISRLFFRNHVIVQLGLNKNIIVFK